MPANNGGDNTKMLIIGLVVLGVCCLSSSGVVALYHFGYLDFLFGSSDPCSDNSSDYKIDGMVFSQSKTDCYNCPFNYKGQKLWGRYQGNQCCGKSLNPKSCHQSSG